MRASAHTVVSAPAENVWAVVCDPERVLSFMSGITRWEVESERPTGLGARYRTLMRAARGGRTRVEIRLAYGVAGAGLSGWLAERIAARAVTAHLRSTVGQLKRQVEHERLRELAERRRAQAA